MKHYAGVQFTLPSTHDRNKSSMISYPSTWILRNKCPLESVDGSVSGTLAFLNYDLICQNIPNHNMGVCWDNVIILHACSCVYIDITTTTQVLFMLYFFCINVIKIVVRIRKNHEGFVGTMLSPCVVVLYCYDRSFFSWVHFAFLF